MTLPVDPARYAAFLAAMSMMAIAPGPANLFAIATGMQRGRGQVLVGGGGGEAAPPGGVGGRGAPVARSAFIDGFSVQIANPKALLFFTAVLPPFLDPARPLTGQLPLYAAATIGMDVVAMTASGLGGADDRAGIPPRLRLRRRRAADRRRRPDSHARLTGRLAQPAPGSMYCASVCWSERR